MKAARVVFLLAAALVASAALAEDWRVGISADNPPWSYVPERLAALEAQTPLPAATPAQFKTITGIDVDVAQALAREMGVTLVLVPAQWLQIEKELLDGKFDAIVSSWTPGRRTPAAIASSDPYLSWGLVICVRGESRVTSLKDLAGSKIGHYKDPAVEQTLRSLGTHNVTAFDSEFTLFQALQKGDIEAVVHDSTFTRWRTNRDPALHVVGQPLNKLGYHVGVRREDAALLAKVQAAVQALVASPELEKIRARGEAFGRK